MRLKKTLSKDDTNRVSALPLSLLTTRHVGWTAALHAPELL